MVQRIEKGRGPVQIDVRIVGHAKAPYVATFMALPQRPFLAHDVGVEHAQRVHERNNLGHCAGTGETGSRRARKKTQLVRTGSPMKIRGVLDERLPLAPGNVRRKRRRQGHSKYDTNAEVHDLSPR